MRYNSNSLYGIPLPPLAFGPKGSTVYKLFPCSIKELCLKPPSCPFVLPPVNPQWLPYSNEDIFDPEASTLWVASAEFAQLCANSWSAGPYFKYSNAVNSITAFSLPEEP